MPPIRGTITLKASDRPATVPEPCLPLDGLRLDVYRRLWNTPVATLWTEGDAASVTRLTLLNTTPEALRSHRLLCEARLLEDRLLLNAYVRAQQRVVIVDDDGSEIEDNTRWLNDVRRRLAKGQ